MLLFPRVVLTGNLFGPPCTAICSSCRSSFIPSTQHADDDVPPVPLDPDENKSLNGFGASFRRGGTANVFVHEPSLSIVN